MFSLFVILISVVSICGAPVTLTEPSLSSKINRFHTDSNTQPFRNLKGYKSKPLHGALQFVYYSDSKCKNTLADVGVLLNTCDPANAESKFSKITADKTDEGYKVIESFYHDSACTQYISNSTRFETTVCTNVGYELYVKFSNPPSFTKDFGMDGMQELVFSDHTKCLEDKSKTAFAYTFFPYNTCMHGLKFTQCSKDSVSFDIYQMFSCKGNVTHQDISSVSHECIERPIGYPESNHLCLTTNKHHDYDDGHDNDHDDQHHDKQHSLLLF